MIENELDIPSEPVDTKAKEREAYDYLYKQAAKRILLTVLRTPDAELTSEIVIAKNNLLKLIK